MTRTAVVCGAGGFIGSHLVKRLKREGYWAFPAAAISAACHQASPATITICRRENFRMAYRKMTPRSFRLALIASVQVPNLICR